MSSRRRTPAPPRPKALPASLAALLSRLTPLGEVKARAMFGGHGVYLDGQIFGIAAGERIFFKIDDTTRPRYEAKGMEVFRPYDDHVTLASYFEVPPDVLDDGDAVRNWATEAHRVAQKAARARATRGPSRKRR